MLTDIAHSAANTPVKLQQNHRGQWQLHATQADLPKLLEEIAHRGNTAIHYSSLPGGKVDATCIGNITELLQCLLGSGVNMAYQQAEPGRHGEIWIMGSSLAQPATSQPACAPSTENDKAPPPDPMQVTADWLEKARAKDPAQRAIAMAELATGDATYDPQIRQALNQGLADDNPQVRVQALEALTKREGEFTSGEQLRKALNDSNLDVRLMAVERIESDTALLQLATQNSEAIVREFATAKLEQLNQP